MTSEKSNNNHKPASPAEPADEMSGDEMYAAATELPYDDPRKAYLEDQMRKLYGSVIDRLVAFSFCLLGPPFGIGLTVQNSVKLADVPSENSMFSSIVLSRLAPAPYIMAAPIALLTRTPR